MIQVGLICEARITILANHNKENIHGKLERYVVIPDACLDGSAIWAVRVARGCSKAHNQTSGFTVR